MKIFSTLNRFLLITIFINLITQTLFSQNSTSQGLSFGEIEERCGFDKMNQTKMSDPAYRQLVEEHNLMISKEINKGQAKTGLVIPVVVHVLHKGEPIGVGSNISDAQILSAISNLNAVYSNTFGTMPSIDMGVQFVMAARDPNCLATNGILRVDASDVTGYTASGCQLDGAGVGANETTLKNLSKWPTDKYMNFWIVSELGGNNGGCGVQGYANLPVGIDAYNGSVMMAGTFGYDPTGSLGYVFGACGGDNSTVVHEVGHFLDLYHTFEGGGDGACPPNETSCSTQNDLVCDTPPHMHYMTSNSALYFSCANGHANECSTGNMDQVIHNIMNYTSCPDRFTAGQKTRMAACLATSRLSLTVSLGAVAPTGAYTPPIAAGCTPLTSGLGLTGGYAGITEVVFNDLISSSSSTDIDNPTNGYMNFTTSCLNVATVQAGQTYPLKVTTWFNTQKVKAWIDYNNNGVFTDAGEELTPAGGLTSTSGAQVIQSVVIPASPTLNTSLRLRIISEMNAGPTSGSCHASTYGQCEDYTVIITSTTLAAAVAISSSDADNSICPGESVTFTATPTNGGAGPLYQWSVGGVNVGTNSSTSTFTTTTLTTGQSVTCVMTSNLAGVTASPATSNAIITTVTVLVPSVTIAITSGANPSCSGESLTFTATPTNGGTTPTYDWKVDGVSTASTSTFTTSTLTSGQIVTCVMTSNSPCATPLTGTSNGITITLSTTIAPTVSIAVTAGANPTIALASITFTATPTTGGTTPSYQWQVDGMNAGTDSPTFTTTTLTDNQVVTCVLTSNSTCASPLIANSLPITVTITTGTTPAPTGSASQTLCSPSTIASLVATGTLIQWYAASTGGTVLATSTTLVDGLTYFATQTLLGIESSSRLAVTVIVSTVLAPTGASPQAFCSASTVANLVANGTAVQWFSAASGGTALLNTVALANGLTYYASQTVATCPSATRLAVAVTIGGAATPTGSTIQSFCSSGTIANLVATGTSLVWFSSLSGGSALSTSTVLTNGVTYYASQTVGGCASATRLPVVVSIVNTLAPTGLFVQTLCPNSTVANLSATGTSIQWFTTSSGGTALATSTALTTGTTYYASQTVSGCSSSSRLSVTVAIGSSPSAPTGSASQHFCGSPTIADLVPSGTTIVWYPSATLGTALLPSMALSNASNYYAAQSNGSCESLTRLAVAVSIDFATTTSVSVFPIVCLHDPALTLTQGSPIGGTYTGTGVSGGVFNPMTAGLGVFTITYSYTNVNLCTTTSTGSIVVDDCVGLSEVNGSQYVIFPNPANESIIISSNNEPIKCVKLFDNTGRLVVSEEMSGFDKEVKINLNNYSEGIYTVQISSESTIVNSKITINK